MERQQKRLGVSFCGGGVKALAQFAVYEELYKQNIRVTAVTGTSMGAFLASGLALGMPPEQMWEMLLEADAAVAKSGLFSNRALLNLLPFRHANGLVIQDKLAEVLRSHLKAFGDTLLSEVPLPLAMPAVDLITGKLVIFTNRPDYFREDLENACFYSKDIRLADAVLCSCAYPVVLTPVLLDEFQLTDGGVRLNSPAVLFKRDLVDFVLAVRLKRQAYGTRAEKSREVGLRTISILINQQNQDASALAKVDAEYVLPVDIGDVFSFGQSERVMEAGREALKQLEPDWDFYYEEPEPVVVEKQGLLSGILRGIFKRR